MTASISNQLRGVFIPVSNIEQARDWYCNLLGLKADGEIFFGHIYVLPMQGGVNLILDSKIYKTEHVFEIPVVQLASTNIQESYASVQSQNIEIVSEIQNNHWFNIKDPDGNVLMICE